MSAVRMSPGGECEPCGIPYYLPKPLLVVAKNVRHIDEAKVGLTGSAPIPGSFDNQADYANLNANVSFPATPPDEDGGGGTEESGIDGTQPFAREQMTPSDAWRDGITPDSFFSYQIVFVPDLSQKYGLQISGGPGEVRAAMNMVNGWMYTGMGPFYLKDSSTAQNRMACGVQALFTGRGAADVLNEVSDIAALGVPSPNTAPSVNENTTDTIPTNTLVNAVTEFADAIKQQQMIPAKMLNYAEIYIYEPELSPDGQMHWELIVEHHFDRDYMTRDPSLANTDQQMLGIIGQLLQQQQVSPPAGEAATPPGQTIQMPLELLPPAAETRDESGEDSGDLFGPAIPGAIRGGAQRAATNAGNAIVQRALPGVTNGIAPYGGATANEVNVNVASDDSDGAHSHRRGWFPILRRNRPVIQNRTNVFTTN
ncbi:MAG: hypothetical protein AAF456_03475 [Planctomycetota bacterium]